MTASLLIGFSFDVGCELNAQHNRTVVRFIPIHSRPQRRLRVTGAAVVP
jgi:hypothetical protein